MRIWYALLLFLLVGRYNSSGQVVWSPAESTMQQRSVTPGTLWRLNQPALAELLDGIPGAIIPLPMPDGSTQMFRIEPSQVLHPALAAHYPEIKTFTATAVGEPGITARIDISASGFHAMVLNGRQLFFVDPQPNGLYLARTKSAQAMGDAVHCLVAGSGSRQKESTRQRTSNGYTLRKFRLALACDHQYAQAATGLDNPTKAQTLSKMVTTINRINGVYERELAITMQLVANTDTLIYTDTAGDPFGTANNNPAALIALNQKMCDSLIKTPNYDIGHLFSTGAGGLSQVGCVCNSSMKAQSVTGRNIPLGDDFDIDYVAHEIGHSFGANHTFNNNESGSCAGNAEPDFAYEPGSGSTIMAYAGICNPDNIQAHSDAYFAAISLKEIVSYVTTAGSCYTTVPTTNKPVGFPAFSAFYNIPKQTPFELTAPIAVDSVSGAAKTYCWEQANLGDFGRSLSATQYYGPLFRSFTPDTSRTRIFPNLDMVLSGATSNAGNNNAEGEKLPDVQRYLTFRLTARNVLGATGCFLIPDDSVHIDVAGTAGPFKVTSQNEEGLLYIGSSVQQINWDVSGTTAAPINTTSVDIYLSDDGGNKWPYYLGNFPNTGSAIVTLPNPPNNIVRGRFKVKAHGNIYFNLNLRDFAIINNPDSSGAIRLFPNPAHNTVKVVTGTRGTVDTRIFDMEGRIIWNEEINALRDIDVSQWPRGMYIVKYRDVRGSNSYNKLVID